MVLVTPVAPPLTSLLPETLWLARGAGLSYCFFAGERRRQCPRAPGGGRRLGSQRCPCLTSTGVARQELHTKRRLMSLQSVCSQLLIRPAGQVETMICCIIWDQLERFNYTAGADTNQQRLCERGVCENTASDLGGKGCVCEGLTALPEQGNDWILVYSTLGPLRLQR